MLALFAAYVVVLFLVSDAVVVAIRGHTETTESTLYVVAFGLVMPVSFALVWLVGSGSAYRQNMDLLATGAGVVIGFGVLAQRLLNHRPLWESRVALALTLACLVAVHVVGLRPLPRLRAAMTARRGLMVLGAACSLALLAAAPWDMFAIGVFWRAAVAAIVALGVYRLARSLGLPRWLAVIVDVGFAVALVMALTDLYYWDVVFFEHSEPYLGAVNDVLHGRAVLVNTVSQYGVGVIYFLAAIFRLIPVRLGTFMLLLSALTAIQFIFSYCTLLVARTPRGIALVAVALAVLCTADFSLLTANTSPLRFGPPYVLVGLAVVARTRHRLSRAADLGAFLVLGLASIWSLEAFGEVAVAFIAMEAVSSVTLQPAFVDGVRRFLKRLGLGLLVVVGVQLLFALLTRLGSGAWPDWSWYLQLVSVWTVHQYGDLPVERWSAGFLLAGLYLISAGTVALIVLRRRAAAEQMLPGLVAIAGYTAFGGAMFSYFVGRSHPIVLWDVAPPGIILLGLWLGVLVSRSLHLGVPVRMAAVALAGALGLILFELRTVPVPIVRAYSVLSTVVGEAAPGVSVGSGLKLIWSSPPPSPLVLDATQLVDRFAPLPSQPTAVLLPDQNGPEVLLQVRRANALPFAYAAQDFVVRSSVDRIFRAVDRLPRGTLLITTAQWWNASTAPPIPPLRSKPEIGFNVFGPVNAIGDAYEQRLVIDVRRRYRCEVLVPSSFTGLTVARLGPLQR